MLLEIREEKEKSLWAWSQGRLHGKDKVGLQGMGRIYMDIEKRGGISGIGCDPHLCTI